MLSKHIVQIYFLIQDNLLFFHTTIPHYIFYLLKISSFLISSSFLRHIGKFWLCNFVFSQGQLNEVCKRILSRWQLPSFFGSKGFCWNHRMGMCVTDHVSRAIPVSLKNRSDHSAAHPVTCVWVAGGWECLFLFEHQGMCGHVCARACACCRAHVLVRVFRDTSIWFRSR